MIFSENRYPLFRIMLSPHFARNSSLYPAGWNDSARAMAQALR
jgi:hypothetical protein